jgi:FtsZ-interacting cell division protein ZipA
VETQDIVIVVVVVVVVALIALALLAWSRRKRSHELQGRFGPEYGHAVSEHGGRRQGEKDLAERDERRTALDIHPLAEDRRQHYGAAWRQLQMRFVDEPESSVMDANRLVTEAMAERGYPTDDLRRQTEDLSVDHPEVAGDYREANRIAEASKEGHATTEELREAMLRYRALFALLLEGETPVVQ